VERAESALLEAIQLLHADDPVTDGLLRGTVRASMRASHGVPEQHEEELTQASSMLPRELQQVLRLSRDLRQCFVLRFLLGLSRKVCARLLHAELSEIDEHTFAALRELSTFTKCGALQGT
jgi:DNA-directed RNA polymerase specialized sigma24 family protein